MDLMDSGSERHATSFNGHDHPTGRPPARTGEQRVSVLVIGGGQAGLATGFYLQKLGIEFQIMDAGRHVGDTWRTRWKSLRLFTPSAFNQLPGAPWPRPAGYYPTKDEVADYLRAYAHRVGLPVALGCRVESLHRVDGRFVAATSSGPVEANGVVVATGPYTHPHLPDLAAELDPQIHQVHSSAYQDETCLPPGPVLVVGAGNSGAEIALELSASRTTYLAGRDTGHVPFTMGARSYRFLQRLTVDTAAGRRLRRHLDGKGHPLVRVSPHMLRRAGVRRTGPVVATAGGRPVASATALDVSAVVWCTGFRPDYRWIHLGQVQRVVPAHRRGVAVHTPNLYFVGLPFQSSATSHLLGGVATDARHVVQHLAAGRGRDAANGLGR